MVNWTAENDAKLLIIILKVHSIKFDYDKVAEAFGQEVTTKAIKNRVERIKKAGTTIGGDEPTSPRAVKAPITPTKRKAKMADIDGASPTPKKRGPAPKKVKVVKREASSSDFSD